MKPKTLSEQFAEEKSRMIEEAKQLKTETPEAKQFGNPYRDLYVKRKEEMDRKAEEKENPKPKVKKPRKKKSIDPKKTDEK
jgi:hypothetical protein